MRFALQEDRLGTLELDCAHGYVVTQYDLGFPEVREVSYNRTLVDGTVDQTRTIGARPVSLQITLDSAVQPASKLRDAVLGYLHPRLRPTLLITEHNDDRLRQMKLRASSAGIPIASPRVNQMQVSWVAPDGVIEAQTASIYQARPFSSIEEGRDYDLEFDREYPPTLFAGALLIDNPGNTYAEWTVNLYGAVVNPRLVLDSEQIRFTAAGGLTLAANQLVVVDSRTRQVLSDGNPLTSVLQSVDFTSTSWWKIPPGQSIFRLDADSWDDNASAVLEFRPTWI